jgi:alkanesulfonate monooxygenase SsuD/methylene tetrahydromethanopterin reductase-like flavin-dependent oxidoreductase (luciferase family)
MRVFGFDLLPHPEHFDHLKVEGELPYPLPKRHFRPGLAVRNYRDHLDAWVRMEALGFDGIGFNEHHTSPRGPCRTRCSCRTWSALAPRSCRQCRRMW